MEIEPLPSVPVAPVAPVEVPGVGIVGAVMAGTLMVGAVTSPGAAPAGVVTTNDAIDASTQNAKIAAVARRRRAPELPFRDLMVTEPRRVGDAQLRTVLSRNWSSIAFHDGVGPSGPGGDAVHWLSAGRSISSRLASASFVICCSVIPTTIA